VIARLTGRLAAKEPGRIVVDVQGVGYEVFIPFSTFYQLPELGREVSLHTFTHVREDAIQLYGFSSLEEKALFEMLGGVQGIGPRLANNILSGAPVEELVPAIADGDLARLKAIPGVGKKTAERLVVELKEKVRQVPVARAAEQVVPIEVDAALGQVVSALVNLGCSRKEALRAAEAARGALGPEAEFEKLIKQAFRQLSEGG
jgi:Holliday junction DNA helicase RuvA